MTDADLSSGMSEVRREPLAVMFLEVVDTQAGITQGWERLEAAIGDLRGRRFFGTVEAQAPGYRVCVQRRETDQPAELELSSGTIPGGRYLRVRLRGEPPALYQRIAPTVERLEATGRRDNARPVIEHYRRRDEVDVLMPLADD